MDFLRVYRMLVTVLQTRSSDPADAVLRHLGTALDGMVPSDVGLLLHAIADAAQRRGLAIGQLLEKPTLAALWGDLAQDPRSAELIAQAMATVHELILTHRTPREPQPSFMLME